MNRQMVHPAVIRAEGETSETTTTQGCVMPRARAPPPSRLRAAFMVRAARLFDWPSAPGYYALMRDADVRSALRATVLARHLRDPSTLVVDELGLDQGAVRVDIAVVNGRLHGYEIKSDADTLDRLPTQAAAYSRVFDRVTLVAGLRHLDKAAALVPPWWGLRAAEANAGGGVRFRCVRPELANPDVDLAAVAALLWREEALALLVAEGRARGLASKPRRDLCAALVATLPAAQLRRSVRDALKTRTTWRAGSPHT